MNTYHHIFSIPIEFSTYAFLSTVSTASALTIYVNKMIYGTEPQDLNSVRVVMAREGYSADIDVTCLVIGY